MMPDANVLAATGTRLHANLLRRGSGYERDYLKRCQPCDYGRCLAKYVIATAAAATVADATSSETV